MAYKMKKTCAEQKISSHLLKHLQGAGIKEMELTSFVSPKWVPQMADAEEIVENSEQSADNLSCT